MISPYRDSYDLILINTPALDYSFIKENDQNNVPPLGLNSIANYCNTKGFKVSTLDAEEQGLNIDQIIREINKERTRFIGLNAVSENIEIAIKIAKRIKHPVVLGGIHATLSPDDTIQKIPFLYGLVMGEGEKPMLDILSGKHKSEVASLVYVKDHKTIFNLRCGFMELSELPIPYPEKYIIRKSYYLMTSRGCPHDCSFCASPILSQRIVRFVPMDNVATEMVRAYNVGYTSFHFLDDQFLISTKRTEEFITKLRASGLFGKITWRGMVRIDTINSMKDDLLFQLKDSGCDLLSIGIESGCERILRAIHKKTTNKMVKEAVKKLKSFGIRVKGFIILGFLDETLEEMAETKSLVMELGEIGMEYFNIAILKPYPGTETYYRLLGRGYTPEDIFFDASNDKNGINKRFVHGFYNQLNEDVRIAKISNQEIREVSKDIIFEFEKRFC